MDTMFYIDGACTWSCTRCVCTDINPCIRCRCQLQRYNSFTATTATMEVDEIKSIWYSLGLRGGNSENEWAMRIKFARAIEEYLKGKK